MEKKMEKKMVKKMVIYKYCIFSKINRKQCDLVKSESLIKGTYRDYKPEAQVTVNNDFYFTLSRNSLSRREAVMIGRTMSRNSCLSKYCDPTTKNHRLFKRYEKMELDDFLIGYLKNLYDRDVDSEDDVTRYIVKYRFYKKEYRERFDLLDIGVADTIKFIYKIYRPDAKVRVFQNHYTVITETPLLRREAVAIGKAMSSDRELSQYRDFGTTTRRLFEGVERLKVDEQVLESIYYYSEGRC